MYRPNKLIGNFILADFFLQSGWGFVGPVFAIFMMENISGATIGAIGVAAGIYWITKSTAQPFFARTMDIIKGDEDDINFLIIGLVALSVLSLAYLLATNIWHIFLIELLRGIAQACVVPAWYGMFTHYMDQEWRSFTWALHSTFIGYALGFTAIFGGMIADRAGFNFVFFLVALSALISAIIVYNLKRKNLKILNEEQEVS